MFYLGFFQNADHKIRIWVQVIYLTDHPGKHKIKSGDSDTGKGQEITQDALITGATAVAVGAQSSWGLLITYVECASELRGKEAGIDPPLIG